MRFPPEFLDEIRARVPVSEVCARQVKLIRRGREFVGLSPFNKEKSPSFTVNDEKGFFHCFSSGRHGDVFSFLMETQGLSFADAVERLAEQAGLELPQAHPEDRARAVRRKDLHDVVEAACAWFEAQLTGPAGRDARAYFHGRGLDDVTVAHFRLGYAPRGDGFMTAMAQQGIATDMLVEAGLARRPDDGRSPFAFFRERAIFPIGDRRGRIVAFGGRVMGEGEPKYLNSPDTPLFDKGRTLYNLAAARKAAHGGTSIAAGPAADGSGEVVVAEGYMDVIALVRAGFPAAVAPLGTALTEQQLEELWRMAAEPILCFDGDAAGARAAARVLDRALPHLKPGKSLRFAVLLKGEDPDSLIAREGPSAMRQVLMGARTLVDVLWSVEAGAGPVDTPERRADLEARLSRRVAAIADGTVQGHYRSAVRERLFNAFRPTRAARRRDGSRQESVRDRREGGSPPARLRAMVAAMRGGRRRQQAILAALVNHPPLREEFLERLVDWRFEPDLDKLWQGLQNLFAGEMELEPGLVRHHFSMHDIASVFNGVLSRAVYDHAPFARAEASLEEARRGLAHLMGRDMVERQRVELQEFGRNAADSEDTRAGERLLALSAAAMELDEDLQDIDVDTNP